MRVLSLWQPWASLIADGRKRIETRHWELRFRGPLAIHAAQKIDRESCEKFGYDYKTIPRGSIVCLVNVEDCVQFPHPLAPPDDYGDFEHGRFGFILSLRKVFHPPIPAKGFQGIWIWPYPLERQSQHERYA